MIYLLIGILIFAVLYSIGETVVIKFFQLLKYHYVGTAILMALFCFFIGYAKLGYFLIILMLIRCVVGYINTYNLTSDLNRACTHLGYISTSDLENRLKSAQKRFYTKGDSAYKIISRFVDPLNDMARKEMASRVDTYLEKRPIVEIEKIKSELDFSDYKQTYTIEQGGLIAQRIWELLSKNILEFTSPQKDTIKLVDFSNNEHADSIEIFLDADDLQGLENALNGQLD